MKPVITPLRLTMLAPKSKVSITLSPRGAEMTNRIASTVLLLSFACALLPSLAHSDDSKRGWWRSAWREPYWESPCEVKIESKRGEFKREVKCKDGVGATWRGEWKEEFWDGTCKVKLEATREEFKEEVKCKGR